MGCEQSEISEEEDVELAVEEDEEELEHVEQEPEEEEVLEAELDRDILAALATSWSSGAGEIGWVGELVNDALSSNWEEW